jgi:hypothetical protein
MSIIVIIIVLIGIFGKKQDHEIPQLYIDAMIMDEEDYGDEF